jgi:hypothetical protein
MRKAIAVSGAESLSDEVRRDLVESVFADTQSMVLGAFMTIVNGLAIAVVAHSWPAVGASAMIALVVVARIRLKWIYQSRTRGNAFTDVRWLERHYVIGMIAYLLAVGLLAVAAFVASDDAFVLTLAVSCAMTHALGIAVRNFAIRTGVGLQLSAVGHPAYGRLPLRGRHVSSVGPFVARALVLLHLWFGFSASKHSSEPNRLSHRVGADRQSIRFRDQQHVAWHVHGLGREAPSCLQRQVLRISVR